MRNGYGRRGYTLLEILVATTLALLLMYGVAAVFSQIGTLMSQTQNVMGMSNSLRSTRDRLATDLSSLTVPKLQAPTSQYGFFSYSEGLGADYHRILTDADNTANALLLDSRQSHKITSDPSDPLLTLNAKTFSPQATARDTEGGGSDTTVGDTDDILSFTAKAPAGQWYRGRFLVVDKPDPDDNSTWTYSQQIIESEFAEIIWFVRGTTLYRRVLLIVPNEVLQESLKLKQADIDSYAASLGLSSIPSLQEGYGFYQFYDVSVHLDDNGKLVANTLSDLANRKNRYGVWSSPVLYPNDDGSVPWSVSPNDQGLYGYNNAWYWLRMPTLQESATAPINNDVTNANRYFRAGVPFGFTDTAVPNSDLNQRWLGTYTALSLNLLNNVTLSTALPDTMPFIDYWDEPNPWTQVNPDSGDLNFALYPDGTADAAKLYSQDVLLTNVLSFDVKVWESSDYNSGEYVDLGCGYQSASNAWTRLLANYIPLDTVTNQNALDEAFWTTEANTFTDFGRYKYNSVNLSAWGKNITDATAPVPNQALAGYHLNFPFMPAVFDTWTADYEKEHLQNTYSDGTNTFTNVTRRRGFTAADIPLDGSVTSAHLPDYPPPYDKELTGLQIEIRVFDPVSRSIKNVTLNADMKRK